MIKFILILMWGISLVNLCKVLHYYIDSYFRYKKSLNSIKEQYDIFSKYIELKDVDAEDIEDFSGIIDFELLRKFLRKNKKTYFNIFAFRIPPSMIREILLFESEFFLAIPIALDSKKLRCLKEDVLKIQKDVRIIMIGYDENASLIIPS